MRKRYCRIMLKLWGFVIKSFGECLLCLYHIVSTYTRYGPGISVLSPSRMLHKIHNLRNPVYEDENHNHIWNPFLVRNFVILCGMELLIVVLQFTVLLKHIDKLSYAQFLQKEPFVLLEDVPVSQWNEKWYLQDSIHLPSL